MVYVQVIVSSNKFHGDSWLTYSSAKEIPYGTLVKVPLRSTQTTGIALKTTTKPTYPVKPITDVFDGIKLDKTKIDLIHWMSKYYPSNLSSAVSLFIPSQLSQKTAQTTNDPCQINHTIPAHKLTDEQSEVVSAIENDTKNSSFLLHGETGTGKTRVYIELTQKQLASGRSVIILTPEISLTPQLLAEFQKHIGRQIYVLHSNLTEASKRNIWLHVQASKQPVVVIGPRSALFAPVNKLGLVIIDECHDSSYKQDQSPRYNSLFVAGQLAKLHSAKLVLGSATPNIADYFLFKSKNLPILRMQKNATGVQHKPTIEIVDIKDKSKFGSNPYLSINLIEHIKRTLSDKKQALVFLNKRGSARLVTCNNCGWVELCPNCQIPLTFHQDQHTLRCHTCGFSKTAVINCSNCSSSDISYRLLGTKSLFGQLSKLFPDANIQRFDTDSTKTEKLENNYADVKSGKIDIIVGTQILAKGLDLPKLGLVGVVSADSNLSFPDYRSEENNFQLLKQIIGRVSRGHTQGSVIIQTMNPDSSSLKAAIENNWDEFYSSQLTQRSDFCLPPFCYVLKILIQRSSVKSAQAAGKKIIESIDNLNIKVDISGPAPRFNEQAMGKINWQIIVKSTKRSELLKIVEALPANVNYDIDPINLL